MVSNLSVKPAFDGREMEVGEYKPSLLKSTILIWALIKNRVGVYDKKH